MRGEIKHIINKATERIYRVSLRPDFQGDIAEFRKHYKIPKETFGWGWPDESFEKAKGKNPLQYYYDQEKILLKYRRFGLLQTDTYRNLLERFILSGRVFASPEPYPNASFYIEMPDANEFKAQGRSFLKLVIYDTASQDDMIDYITENAPRIKDILKTHSPLKEVRKTKNLMLEQRLRELAQMKHDELKRLAGIRDAASHYKHSLIHKILKREGYPAVPKPDTLKKALERLRTKGH